MDRLTIETTVGVIDLPTQPELLLVELAELYLNRYQAGLSIEDWEDIMTRAKDYVTVQLSLRGQR
jgi:hypothetical protein